MAALTRILNVIGSVLAGIGSLLIGLVMAALWLGSAALVIAIILKIARWAFS